MGEEAKGEYIADELCLLNSDALFVYDDNTLDFRAPCFRGGKVGEPNQ